ncbi:hypothetical protein [Streptomyces rimosus]|uniref:hypothetical protein n=1 Tax=Streptomyces rimosus TaxID=1927 RepID=UPI0037D868AA
MILSAAVTFGKVLLPAPIRRSVPAHRIQGISALYVTVMGVTAAVSSGIAAPLSPTLPGSWHPALAWGVAFTVAAFLAWLPRMRGDRPQSDKPQSDRPHTTSPLWRPQLARQLSMFMGLPPLAFYTAAAWLPSNLIHRSSTSTTAGCRGWRHRRTGVVPRAVRSDVHPARWRAPCSGWAATRASSSR